MAISNRAIINSSHFSSTREYLRAIVEDMQAVPNCSLSDLTWSGVTAWRELIAQFFDVMEHRPYRVGIDHITIEYAAPPPSSSLKEQSSSSTLTMALFLAAWLKNRLGWHLSQHPEDNVHDEQNGSHGWHMSERDLSKVLSQPLDASSTETPEKSTATDGIQIIVRPRQLIDSEPGTICLVRMHSTSDGKEAIFKIERGDDDDHVITNAEIPGNTQPQRTVSIASTHKESDLLHNELEITRRDYLYEETLRDVLALMG